MTDSLATLILSAAIFAAVMLGMAIGVIFKRKPLAGSCGGLAAFNGGDCEICGGDPAKCESNKTENPA